MKSVIRVMKVPDGRYCWQFGGPHANAELCPQFDNFPPGWRCSAGFSIEHIEPDDVGYIKAPECDDLSSLGAVPVVSQTGERLTKLVLSLLRAEGFNASDGEALRREFTKRFVVMMNHAAELIEQEQAEQARQVEQERWLALDAARDEAWERESAEAVVDDNEQSRWFEKIDKVSADFNESIKGTLLGGLPGNCDHSDYHRSAYDPTVKVCNCCGMAWRE